MGRDMNSISSGIAIQARLVCRTNVDKKAASQPNHHSEFDRKAAKPTAQRKTSWTKLTNRHLAQFIVNLFSGLFIPHSLWTLSDFC